MRRSLRGGRRDLRRRRSRLGRRSLKRRKSGVRSLKRRKSGGAPTEMPEDEDKAFFVSELKGGRYLQFTYNFDDAAGGPVDVPEGTAGTDPDPKTEFMIFIHTEGHLSDGKIIMDPTQDCRSPVLVGVEDLKWKKCQSLFIKEFQWKEERQKKEEAEAEAKAAEKASARSALLEEQLQFERAARHRRRAQARAQKEREQREQAEQQRAEQLNSDLAEGVFGMNVIHTQYKKKYKKNYREEYIINNIPLVYDSESEKKLYPFKVEVKEANESCFLRRASRNWFTMAKNKKLIHKLFLYFKYRDQIDYFNHLFRIVCAFKSLDLPFSSTPLEDWLKKNKYERDKTRCYPVVRKGIIENPCRGTSGETEVWKKDETGDGKSITVKKFRFDTLKKHTFKDIELHLTNQAKESIICYNIKKAGDVLHETPPGKKYITEIKKLIFTIPSKSFLKKMMSNCLEYSDDLYFPVILMKDAGEDLHSAMEDKDKKTILMKERKNLMKELAEGISYMNMYFYFHQDIKEQNICVKKKGGKYTIRIIDLGAVRKFDTPEDAKNGIQTSGSLLWAYPFSAKGGMNGRCDLCDLWAYMMIVTNVFFEHNSKITGSKESNPYDKVSSLYSALKEKLKKSERTLAEGVGV